MTTSTYTTAPCPQCKLPCAVLDRAKTYSKRVLEVVGKHQRYRIAEFGGCSDCSRHALHYVALAKLTEDGVQS